MPVVTNGLSSWFTSLNRRLSLYPRPARTFRLLSHSEMSGGNSTGSAATVGRMQHSRRHMNRTANCVRFKSSRAIWANKKPGGLNQPPGSGLEEPPSFVQCQARFPLLAPTFPGALLHIASEVRLQIALHLIDQIFKILAEFALRVTPFGQVVFHLFPKCSARLVARAFHRFREILLRFEEIFASGLERFYQLPHVAGKFRNVRGSQGSRGGQRRAGDSDRAVRRSWRRCRWLRSQRWSDLWGYAVRWRCGLCEGGIHRNEYDAQTHRHN